MVYLFYIHQQRCLGMPRGPHLVQLASFWDQDLHGCCVCRSQMDPNSRLIIDYSWVSHIMFHKVGEMNIHSLTPANYFDVHQSKWALTHLHINHKTTADSILQTSRNPEPPQSSDIRAALWS